MPSSPVGKQTVFAHVDQYGETLTIDDYTLRSGRHLVTARITDPNDELKASVNLPPKALLDLRFKIDEWVTGGGGF